MGRHGVGRGVPHLVPVSLAWVDERIVIAVEASSVTARSTATSGTARLAVGPTRDVVMVDALREKTVDVAADDELGEAYVAQADWDQGETRATCSSCSGGRVQAWREANEIAGRTLMRDGRWLV